MKLDSSCKREVNDNDYCYIGRIRPTEEGTALFNTKVDTWKDGDLEIFINKNDKCKIPHFHIRNKDWSYHSAMKIYEPEYLLHEEGMNYLSEYEIKRIADFMDCYYKRSFIFQKIIISWYILKKVWKKNNKDHKIRWFDKCPNYTKIIKKVDEITELDPTCKIVGPLIPLEYCRDGTIRKTENGIIFLGDKPKTWEDGDLEIFHNEDEKVSISPHFHIRNKDWTYHSALCIEKPEYLLHEEGMNYLSDDELKQINEFMHSIKQNSFRKDITNWENLIDRWDRGNIYNLISDDAKCPDYTKIIKKG